MSDDKVMRSFDTGATRDTAEGKLDMEGFTHPMVMKQFAKYMNMNRLQSDGNLRDSDNWQKGIPIDAYMKSLTRHRDDLWLEHRGFPTEAGKIAALCGIIFNAHGYLLEHLKTIDFVLQDFDGCEPTPEMKRRRDVGKFLELTSHPINVSLGWPGEEEEEEDDVEVPGFEATGPEEVEDTEARFEKSKQDFLAGTLDIIQPIMTAMQEWLDESDEEDLIEVPELPVCFGNCTSGRCRDCKDNDECDTLECEDCEFGDECMEEFIAEDEEPFDDTAPEELGPSQCSGCLSFKKTWNEGPCSECLVNPFKDDPTRHLFFCPSS
jgi:hypothetical protein